MISSKHLVLIYVFKQDGVNAFQCNCTTNYSQNPWKKTKQIQTLGEVEK